MPSRRHPPVAGNPETEIESQSRVWEGRFPLDVVRFRHRRFDGRISGTRVWEIWRRGRAAALLPYDPVKDCVVLIEQYRIPALVAGLDPVLAELPAGLCEEGESPEATIAREMVEEMDLSADRLEPIGRILLSPGGCDELCELFAGRVLAPEAGPDGVAGHAGVAAEEEDIRVRVWPASKAIEAALSGRMANSVAVIGLLWLAARRDWLRQKWTEA